MIGYSEDSDGVNIRASSIPGTPSAPTTTINGALVDFTWDVSSTDSDGGSVINSYIILVRHSDGTTFSPETVNCDGSNSGIVSAKACSIPITVLRAAPFSLDWGASVYAKLTATNVVGTSPESAEGNNAVILTNPDVPTGLVNLPLITDAGNVGIEWTAPVFIGGTPIIDYEVSYDEGASNWVVLAANVVANTYTATGLTTHTVYSFKVKSRNSFG